LVSESAVKHLHKNEEKLRCELTAEANTAAQRKIREARQATEKKIRAELEGEESKRERGLQRMVDALQKQNLELERRLEGLSAPDRGDMNEAEIAEELAGAFPDDEITREGKGGDIVQVVRYPGDNGLEPAGVILYECKDTKRWSNSFISQIKADGRARLTPYLLLVSRALPAQERDACVRDDVVIADPMHARQLARILRRMVIETHRAELAGHDRAGKTARLYEYLRSGEFREHLSPVVEAGTHLSEMLQEERKHHERDWSKRQRTYDQLLHNSVAIEQTIQGIIESEAPPKRRRSARAGRKTARAGGRGGTHSVRV
jgi:hypothetical protein